MVKINCKVDDGKVIFATHFISTTINREDEEVKQKLTPFQVEKDGIVVYPGQNILEVEWILQELKILYTVEKLQHKPEHITKAKNVKYGSRTEAIKNLLEDTEPESQIIPNLKNKLDEKENKIKNLENKLQEKDNQINNLLSEFSKIKNDVAILKNKGW